MKTAFRILNISISLLFIAWIAKLHFIFGGDYLFRLASAGVLLSLVWQFAAIGKTEVSGKKDWIRLFRVNSICLIIVYLGMLLKVAHLMPDQVLKDLVLDFLGIPAVVTAMLYSISRWQIMTHATPSEKLLAVKHLALPWLMFAFSFMLFGIYSLNLIYQVK